MQARAQLAAFKDELRRLGWAEGRNLRIDVRWSKGDVNLIRAHAKELAASSPDVILARTTPVTAALLRETRRVPIVFVVVSDPVGDGFVSTLARPGGNVTGFTNVESSLGGKWIELLKLIKPDLAHVTVIYGAKTAPGRGKYYSRALREASRAISVSVTETAVDDAAHIERVIDELAGNRGAGLLVTPDVTTATHRQLIIQRTAHHRLAAVYSANYFAEDGGLLSYGIDYVDLYRRGATYVNRVLHGEKAGELPVQGPSKFELVINLKTAKALGIALPDSLLARADRIIDP